MQRLVPVLAAVSALAASAHAEDLFIFEQSMGSFVITDETNDDRTIEFDTVVVFEIGGLGIESIAGSFVQTFTGGDFDTFVGSALFTGASDLDTLTVEFNGTLFNNGFDSLSGDWELTGATGAYDIYTGGAGNNSGSYYFTSSDSGDMFMIFQGTLVPAPAGLGLLGLGGLLAARRRR